MNYIVVLNFSNYIAEDIKNVVIHSGLPVIPKIGEWFDPSFFIEPSVVEKLDQLGNMGGAVFVREVQHYFNQNIQQVWLILSLTEADDFYKKRFR